MKNLLLLAVVALLALTPAFAQNEKYLQAMTAALQTFQQQTSGEPDAAAMQELANRFERIGAAEPNEWLPRYYAAYAYGTLGFSGDNLRTKDQYLDKADALLKEAERIPSQQADELAVMKAYITQARLAADPMSRWQTYGAQFGEYLAIAKKSNANNPRIYYLEGTNLFYTPEEYGGGKKAAKPLFEKAMEKYAHFQPASTLHPQWGKEHTRWFMEQCNQ
ncbi:hypothetical protein GCM10027275_05140 [Rhabdobacter roseus]|uniref:Uncharacterized protein n=1 Tax=Rhabdobacter roseus TaxID=1655419 RepID=A0A840THH1_9BACT|nr:hypothetical protein [Rhabdobacter roseus]MBB5282405.1 hypothetical protein [Rhabdobacter roseus]